MQVKLRHMVLLAALGAAAVAAQTPKNVALSVRETAGIRRFGFPVGVRVPFPKGALASAANARVVLNGAEVPAQFTGEGQWPDGSIQWLAVDLNATIGPNETQTYQLEYGAEVKSGPPPRGLSVTEEADAIQVGTVRFSKAGAPLVLSVKYRNEDIGSAGTGFTVTDASGRSLNVASAQPPKLEILKRGPLSVKIRYSGRLAVDTGYSVPFVTTVEMPNSKSWVKVSAQVDDPGKRLREISYQTPLSFGPLPWVWDFGTERWTYGALRNPSDSVVLTETVKAAGTVDWRIVSGPKGKEQAYETSRAASSAPMVRWGHIQDAKEVVAFGVDGNPNRPGKYQFILDGAGGASFRFTAAAPVARHQLTVYQHYVSTPVQIGAATSPAAMLSPLVATFDPAQFKLSGVPANGN